MSEVEDFGAFVLVDQWSINTDRCYPMLRIVKLLNGDLALHTLGEDLDQGFRWAVADSHEFAGVLNDRIAFYRDVAHDDEVHRAIVAREGRHPGWPYFRGNSKVERKRSQAAEPKNAEIEAES